MTATEDASEDSSSAAVQDKASLSACLLKKVPCRSSENARRALECHTASNAGICVYMYVFICFLFIYLSIYLSICMYLDLK